MGTVVAIVSEDPTVTPVQLLAVEPVTHDVRRYRVERPEGFAFEPGQATELAIDADGWRDETRPFTMTSLPSEDTLEFTIKTYPDHDGMTEQLGQLEAGATLLIGDAWGAITDEGAGTFVAGGAGVTPFLAILKQRAVDDALEGCHLVFSNRTEADIIDRVWFEGLTGLRTTFTVTDQPESPLARGRIDEAFLRRTIDDTDQPFYVCGPPEMVEGVTAALKSLGADPDGITLEDG